MGVCPTAVVDLQTTPPVNVVEVGVAVGVNERVGTAVGVGVSETVGVAVGVAVGVLEQAESPPATTNAIAAKYIPRFTSDPFRSDFRIICYSHSIVPGGLLVMSSTTRFTSLTSLVILVEIRSNKSYGNRDQSAVMASSLETGRRTMG